MATSAQRKSFGLVAETCPGIDEALRVFEGVIKDKTADLRNALTNTCDELLDAEAKIETLEEKLSDANSRIAELEAELAAKENENA